MIPDHIRQLQEYMDAEKIADVIEATAAKFGLGPDDPIPEPEVRTDAERPHSGFLAQRLAILDTREREHLIRNADPKKP